MPAEQFGLGFDSQWADDYHHTLHTLLTGEQDGYYEGFPPKVSSLARVLKGGYLYTGQHSTYRARKYGRAPKTKNGAQFVVSMQNHDQVGNRMMGERIAALVPLDRARLAAAAIVLSPFVPMLFMGEEYGEKTPFQYFTSHSDESLIEAVRKGRREEFDDFIWAGEPPDPHAEETFHRSKLNWALREREEHASMWRFYQHLLQLRRDTPALRELDLGLVETHADDEKRVLLMRRGSGTEQVLIAFNFSDKAQSVELPWPDASWNALIDTGAKIAASAVTVPPQSFALWSAVPE
jgi:maltooligosyltrehalose trehalohydrolase